MQIKEKQIFDLFRSLLAGARISSSLSFNKASVTGLTGGIIYNLPEIIQTMLSFLDSGNIDALLKEAGIQLRNNNKTALKDALRRQGTSRFLTQLLTTYSMTLPFSSRMWAPFILVPLTFYSEYRLNRKLQALINNINVESSELIISLNDDIGQADGSSAMNVNLFNSILKLVWTLFYLIAQYYATYEDTSAAKGDAIIQALLSFFMGILNCCENGWEGMWDVITEAGVYFLYLSGVEGVATKEPFILGLTRHTFIYSLGCFLLMLTTLRHYYKGLNLSNTSNNPINSTNFRPLRK